MKNIQTALTETEDLFFVITENEVHSFMTKEEAKIDLEDAKTAYERMNIKDGFVELIDRETAEKKYL